MACGFRSLLFVACLAPLVPALRLVDRPGGIHPDVPWLRFARAAPEGRDQRRERQQAELFQVDARTEDGEGAEDDPVVFQNAHGFFGGMKFFIAALTKGLSQGLLEELASCSIAVQGGGGYVKNPELNASVWIIVNGERATGEDTWDTYRSILPKGDKAVILGPWWNSTHETYSDSQVSSLWVPFASTSFAERKFHTPMDLVDRRNKTRFGGKRRLVAYQQKKCHESNGRENFWDQLNEALRRHGHGLRGNSISACNGRRALGEPLKLAKDGGYKWGSHYDASVGRYEQFNFVWASEHCLNAEGYVTEKIVNAFLAGAVPVYAGLVPEQLHQIFDKDSFIQVFWDDVSNPEGIRRLIVASENEKQYNKLLRPDKPLVSDDAMRRFFTWHPATWEKYGDGLRQRILREALAKCRGEAG